MCSESDMYFETSPTIRSDDRKIERGLVIDLIPGMYSAQGSYYDLWKLPVSDGYNGDGYILG